MTAHIQDNDILYLQIGMHAFKR